MPKSTIKHKRTSKHSHRHRLIAQLLSLVITLSLVFLPIKLQFIHSHAQTLTHTDIVYCSLRLQLRTLIVSNLGAATRMAEGTYVRRYIALVCECPVKSVLCCLLLCSVVSVGLDVALARP